MNRLLTRSALALLTGLALSGCGGGGSDSPDPTPYNVAAAYRNLLTTTNHWALTGTDTLGLVWTMTLDGAPQPPGTFPMTGEAAGRMALTLTASAASASETDTETYYFNGSSATQELIGIDMPNGCARATTFTALPETATIGSSGPLAVMTAYDYCSLAAPVVGTFEARWSLVRDGSVVLVCIDMDYGDGLSEASCFESSTNGALGSHARLTVKWPGYELIAKTY